MKLRKIKQKRASVFLESETIKVVLAVICIGLLVILAYKLYTLFMKKSAIEIARENIGQLADQINRLDEGQNGKFTLTGPNDWYLMLFHSNEPMPGECQGASNCLCICESQTYVGCDQQGVCRPIIIKSEMSYTCFISHMAGLSYQHRCFKIKIQDIPLKRENGILFIGINEDYSIGEKFFEVLNITDLETGNSIKDLLFQRITNRDESLFMKTKKLVTNYLRENVTEISDWSIVISLNGENVATFIEAQAPSYNEGIFVPTFSDSFEREIEKDGQKYLVKFQFNLNK